MLHTAAFWLMQAARSVIPGTNPLTKAEFATVRERLIKIGAGVIEHIARIRIHLPTSCPERTLAVGALAAGPSALEAAQRQINPPRVALRD